MIVSDTMLPPTCVVVPTYWTRPGGEPHPGDAVYDHPTPLDGTSTLPPLLESLEKLDSSFYLLVLVAVTGRDVTDQAERRVSEILAQYPRLTSLVFGPSDLTQLHDWLRSKQLEHVTSLLDLQTYPKVRNLQLAIPLILRSTFIVAVDDDEIVTDPEFVTKAVEPLGTNVDGTRIDGLSGHYEQESGGILLKVDPAKAESQNIFDRKAAIMNAGTEKLESQPGNLVETPFCFGGNMEFTAELAASVGFDPGITRGEDIDYLINARMEGKHFFLRKDLQILHCPPKGGSYKDVSLSKLEQDVIRFVYEREKLNASEAESEMQSVTADELKPYPGEFLQGDIENDAAAALQEAGYPRNAEAFVQDVCSSVPSKVQRYLEFRREWPSAMDGLSESADLFDQLAARVRGA